VKKLFIVLGLMALSLCAVAVVRAFPINVNGQLTLPQDNSSQALPESPQDARRAIALFEGATMVVAESYPPQYFLQVKYGLPNGCARPGGHEVSRQGKSVALTVYYETPADPNILCTQNYRIGDLSIALGSDFTPGQGYEVVVNGKKALTFTAQ